MPNGTYGGVRGRKTKVGEKLLRFPPTRLLVVATLMLLPQQTCSFRVSCGGGSQGAPAIPEGYAR